MKDMPNLEVIFLMHRALEHLRRRTVAEYWRTNQQDDLIAQLNQRQIGYLFTIHQHEPCTLLEVMHHSGLSKSAASTAVAKLVRLKMVTRVRNAADRREVMIRLQPELRGHIEAIDRQFRCNVAVCLAGASAGELAGILAGAELLYQRVLENIHE